LGVRGFGVRGFGVRGLKVKLIGLVACTIESYSVFRYLSDTHLSFSLCSFVVITLKNDATNEVDKNRESGQNLP